MRRSPRLISRSTSVAGKPLNTADSSDRRASKRSRSLSASSALPLQGAGEDLAEELEARQQLVRPGPLGANGSKDSTPSSESPAPSGSDRSTACRSLIALPVDRGMLGQLVETGEPDDVVLPELLGSPGELIRLHDS